MLRDLFAKYGELQSVKLIKDHQTGKSQGYGFVSYASAEAAEQSATELNGQNFEGKTIKVEVARENAPSKSAYGGMMNGMNSMQAVEEEKNNVYICGFPKNYTKESLEGLFLPFGKIAVSRILTDASGVSRCVGFVRMEDKMAAEKSIMALNAKILDGASEPLQVRLAASSNKQKQNNMAMGMGMGMGGMNMMGQGYSGNSMYAPMRGASTFAAQQRYNPFGRPGQQQGGSQAQYGAAPQQQRGVPGANGQYGMAQQQQQVPPPQMNPAYYTGSPVSAGFPSANGGPVYDPYGSQAPTAYDASMYYGQGMVNSMPYGQQNGASQYPGQFGITAQTQGSQFGGNVRANGNSNGAMSTAGDEEIFIFHLPADMTDEKLFQLFQSCGTVLKANVVKDAATGNNKGFGFVTMASAAEAAHAITTLNGYNIGSKWLRVSLKKHNN